jgi:hypothetical protein
MTISIPRKFEQEGSIMQFSVDTGEYMGEETVTFEGSQRVTMSIAGFGFDRGLDYTEPRNIRDKWIHLIPDAEDAKFDMSGLGVPAEVTSREFVLENDLRNGKIYVWPVPDEVNPIIDLSHLDEDSVLDTSVLRAAGVKPFPVII